MRLLALLALLASAAWADAVNLAIRKPATQSSTYQNNPAYAAANGVDGQKYDTSLFSTEEEQSPWWEVDLGAEYAIENVMLYNRVGCCQERARGLQVLLSSDGENYMLVYTHDNTAFRNHRVDIGGLGARYVRVQLPYRGYLHLQEVEVYQYGTWLPSTRPVKWTPVRIPRSGPLPDPTVSGASIEGPWSVNFNGYTGTAEFTRSGSGWVGRLNLGQGAESLTSVSFDSRTGAVSFIRPTVNQHYSGTLSGNGMSGRFDNAYNWSATRTGSTSTQPVATPPQPQPPVQTGASIEGPWSVNFNGYTGTAEFTRSGSGWVGRLNLGQGSESLTSVSFDSRTGAVSFLRPTVNQHYSGTLSGNGMSGRFDNAYNWSATRVAR